MIGRHVRKAGLCLIEEKLAEAISAPSLAALKGKKTRELGGAAPDIKVPKIVALPQS